MLFCVKAIVMNFILAVILFFTNGFIGSLLSKYSFFDYEPLLYNGQNTDDSRKGVTNFSLKVIHPIIFMAVVATILQGILETDAIPWIKTLWLLCPFYWLDQYIYAVVRNRTKFHLAHVERFNFVISFVFFETIFLLIVLLVTEEGKNTVPYLFIPLDELRNAIWYAIIAFVVKDIWQIFKSHYVQSREMVNERVESVLKDRYYELSEKYGYKVDESIRNVFCDSICDRDMDLERNISYLIFAIMIYEDYNRSENFRKIENILHKIVSGTMSVGIMQVQSMEPLTDDQSIEKACELLKPEIDKEVLEVFKQNPDPQGLSSLAPLFSWKIEEIIKTYNGKKLYCEEVKNLYFSIQGWDSARTPVFRSQGSFPVVCFFKIVVYASTRIIDC